jgi:hypothetical protein
VGQQRGCWLALGPARGYAGQHRRLVGASCGHRGLTAVGAGQVHPLSRRHGAWMARVARGPPGWPAQLPPLRGWALSFTAAPRPRHCQ